MKLILLLALLVIGVLYWTLAVISGWLMCNDSEAVTKFLHDHGPLMTLPSAIWCADSFGGRYLVTLILMTVAGWVVRASEPNP